MYALKDKVSNRLSRFFADSPNAPSPPSPLSPSSPPDNPQARLFSKGGNLISSYFSFAVPSLNFSGSTSEMKQELKPIQSGPVRWGRKNFDLQDEGSGPVRYHECSTSENEDIQKSSDNYDKSWELCEKKLAVKTQDNNEARSSSDSDVFEEACEQKSPRKSLPHLMDESVFISPELYEFLQSSLPNIVKGCQWTLLYSTLKHGISLRTLIRKSADTSGSCLLIVGDKQGAVFGGLLDSPLRPTPKRKYQGTNQSFVFTTIYGAPRLFRPTGANRYYYMCLNDLLALGGGNFALSLDGDLLNGTSGPCETYGNLCLAHEPDFELKNVELWGFTHASKYLT